MSSSISIGRVLRRPVGTSESIESTALLVGASVFVVGGLVALPVFWGRVLPISGSGSLGEFVAIGAAAAAILVFVLARIVLGREAGQLAHAAGDIRLDLHWLDVAALAFAHGIIALLAWVGISDVVEQSFIGAKVYPFPGALCAAVALGLTAYVVFLSAVKMTAMLLSLVLAIFLVVGVFASMLSSSNPHWWEENLSALGMNHSVSALAFNVTLIVAGVIVTTIAHAATASIPVTDPASRKRRTITQWGFTLIGLFLTCVGLFPVDQFFLVHNTVATGMAVVFGGLVIGLRWLIPGMPRVFILLGYVFVGVIILLTVFFAVGYYNLTAVELVAAILIFSWIILFLRNASAIGGVDAPNPAR